MKNALSFCNRAGLCKFTGGGKPEPSKYNDPVRAVRPACHGGVQARDQTTVLQNEYSTWVVRDKLRTPL